MDTAHFATLAIGHIGAAAATVYPLRYQYNFPWRKSRIGRALMTKALAVAILFDVPVVGYWLGAPHPGWLGEPGYGWAYLAIVTILTGAVCYQLWVMETSDPSDFTGVAGPS